MTDPRIRRCAGLLVLLSRRVDDLDRRLTAEPSDPTLIATRDTLLWLTDMLEVALDIVLDPEQTTGERWADVARCIATGVHQIDAAHPVTDCPAVKVAAHVPAHWFDQGGRYTGPAIDLPSAGTGKSLFDLPLEQRYHLGGGVGPVPPEGGEQP